MKQPNKRKIKIAIIDSGYNHTNKNITSFVVSNISFVDNNGIDENGHGTNCIDTILNLNRNVEIVSIKITDHLGYTSTTLLNKALKYCIGSDIDIINISISCNSNEKNNTTESLLKTLYMQNKIIVSSVANNLKKSYPASSKYVIGVAGINFAFNKEICFKYENIYYFDNTPVFVSSSAKQKYNFFRGNSKACAYCTGLLSLYISNNNYVLSDIINYLETISIKFSDYQKINQSVMKKIENDYKQIPDIFSIRILKLVNKALNDNSKRNINLIDNLNQLTFSSFTMLNDFNFITFIERIEKETKIKIPYHHIQIKKIYSIKLLLNFIEIEVNQYEKK